ncbi:cytochrome P450 2C19-like [Engystomops pustulosus]|uniref:cytochrome P450 2C19-like n=1 Tax=Engystomops pustulosus TaxID=76066 RepID=UPI003AFB2800
MSCCITILALVIICILKRYNVWTSQAPLRNFPPGPRTLPVIGNLHIVNLKRFSKTLLELSQKYGPVFSIQMGSVRMVVLSGYETVRSALVDYADEFSESPYINIFEDMNQEFGITFSHGFQCVSHCY